MAASVSVLVAAVPANSAIEAYLDKIFALNASRSDDKRYASHSEITYFRQRGGVLVKDGPDCQGNRIIEVKYRDQLFVHSCADC
jgi:hypothetical protein